MPLRPDYPNGALIPGTIYRVLRKLGAGGMGAVYEVEDTTVGRKYVLKAMHPDLCERRDLAHRMAIEARTLGQLAHANIVEAVTAGLTQDEPARPYFVMELLQGRSLRAVLDAKGFLPVGQAIAITLDLLSALEHAHLHGIVHRDVKPDNLFLHRAPRVAEKVTILKLLDFGIMRVARSGSVTGAGESREAAGRFIGTLRYAAPEQLRGEKAGAQTDLYATALVLFEMIAGRGPFDGEGDPQAIATAHLRRQAPRLSSFTPVHPELDELVATALAKNPEERPPDAATFAAALRAIPAEAYEEEYLLHEAGAPSARAWQHPRVLVAVVGVAVAAAALIAFVR